METTKAKQKEIIPITEKEYYQMFFRYQKTEWRQFGQITTIKENVFSGYADREKYENEQLKPYEYKIISIILPY